VSRQVVLLRGINLGSRNRVAMSDLRTAFESAGFDEVQTYLQSGNVVLRGNATAARCRRLLADGLGLDLQVVVRTRRELAAIVDRDPLGDVADDPKRYQITFLEQTPPAALVKRLSELVAGDERFVAHGRELYSWHPAGVARSKLWNAIAAKDLGVVATSRNWTTVTKLLELAGESL
jgi:uncharacterized protein (DUF1697 family)